MKPAALLSSVLLALCACGESRLPPITEQVAAGKLVPVVEGAGELKSAKAMLRRVNGSGWSQRQLVWMPPEGGFERTRDVLARFSSDRKRPSLKHSHYCASRMPYY